MGEMQSDCAQAVMRQSLNTALEGKRNSTPELSPPEGPQPWPLHPQESLTAAKGQARALKGLDTSQGVPEDQDHLNARGMVMRRDQDSRMPSLE